MPRGVSRRRLLLAGLSAMAPFDAAFAQSAAADRPADRVVLLGTMGGPIPSAVRAMASQAVIVGQTPYLVDCGVGAVGRLAAAGIEPRTLAAIFITHLHDDHIGELPGLLMAAWASGLSTPIDIYGPAPLGAMVGQFLAAFEPSIALRMAEFARPHPSALVRVHELDEGLVRHDANVEVSAIRVEHGEGHRAFGYRIVTPRRTIAISGDTAAAPAVRRLADRADVFVAEAMYMPALHSRLQALPSGARMEALLSRIHMTAAEAGRIAAEAQVGALVLSHLIPGDDPAITDEQWIAEASAHFNGPIIVGRDLLVI